MAKKTKEKSKDFDCVEMKNEVQTKLMSEYESRAGEFESLKDFFDAKLKESPWAKSMAERIEKANKLRKSKRAG